MHRDRYRGGAGARLRAATLLGMAVLAGCGLRSDAQSMEEAALLTGGNPYAGKQKIDRFGCSACHTVPGVRGADRQVGPPLAGIGSRMYIAGMLGNTPENMMRWLRDPPSVDSLTAMPNVGLSEQDARDIAAYLYSLD